MRNFTFKITLAICGQNYGSTKNAHILPKQLHLIPELNPAWMVPIVHISINEQNYNGHKNRKHLGCSSYTVSREERQSQHSIKYKHQLQCNFTSYDVIQIGQAVLLTMLQGVSLKIKYNRIRISWFKLAPIITVVCANEQIVQFVDTVCGCRPFGPLIPL